MPRNDRSRAWEALADASSGRLTRPMPTGLVEKPGAVELADGVLGFTRKGAHMDWRDLVEVPPDLLDRFLRARGNAALLSLARKFGPTGLVVDDGGYAVGFKPGYPLREPLAAWEWAQDFFRTVLAVAAQLQEDWSFSEELLEKLSSLQPRERRWADLTKSPETVAMYLEWLLDFQIERAGIRPRLVYSRAGWAGRPLAAEIIFGDGAGLFDHSTLFSALMIQALSAVVGSGFTTCSSCGMVFVPKRTPAAGRRRYCDACRASNQPQRDAKADYRAKLKAKSER